MLDLFDEQPPSDIADSLNPGIQNTMGKVISRLFNPGKISSQPAPFVPKHAIAPVAKMPWGWYPSK